MTSSPESRFRLGNGRFELERHNNDGCRNKPQGCEVGVFEGERHDFAQVLGDFIERGALCHSHQLGALTDVARLLSVSNDSLDDSLHDCSIPQTRTTHNREAMGRRLRFSRQVRARNEWSFRRQGHG